MEGFFNIKIALCILAFAYVIPAITENINIVIFVFALVYIYFIYGFLYLMF